MKSPVGAIGVMQVMPATGKELKVGDIRQLEPNIHAGVKYMRFIDRPVLQGRADGPASTRGSSPSRPTTPGPGASASSGARRRSAASIPNVWFGNVEQIASERIGRETVTYVSNIYKYYVAYRLVVEEKRAARRREEGARVVWPEAGSVGSRPLRVLGSERPGTAPGFVIESSASF